MRKAPLYLLALAFALLLIASCASIGNPSGGPRDEDPPRFVASTPLYGAVEVNPNKVVLTFDELVNLKDAFSKVVVSPPPAQVPRVSSLGRRVTVEFRDTLLPETTYTIDFGDAIVDNNEGNKLENFIYTFSTGPVLDSLMVSGMVLGAMDLIPEEGIYVGLHKNLEDSAFRKDRFDRVAKTDEYGKFAIGGLAPGKYRIYALEDKDGDLAWSSPEESLAFYEAVLEPASEQTVATDTIFNLFTGEVDSVIQRQRTRFTPNNILLRSYNTGFLQQYISKYERLDSTRLNFIFNAPSDSMPAFDLVLPEAMGGVTPLETVAVTERSRTNDTISFWLKNPDIVSTDTLRVAVRYFRADSVYNPIAVNDTLRMLTVRPRVKAKKVEKSDREIADSVPIPVPTIEIKSLNSKPEVNRPLVLELPTPLESFDLSMIHLQWKEDTLWKNVPDFDVGMVVFDSLNPRLMRIEYPWAYETNYSLTVDSLAGKSIYGLFTDDFNVDFTTRPESGYSSIKFNLSNMGDPTVPRFVELLSQQGNPVQSRPLQNGTVTFTFLLPGKYYARVVEDANGNGKWDPGNFDLGIQPDISYYYKEVIDLKANWDQEIDWNVFAIPVDKMVPEELRKRNRKK